MKYDLRRTIRSAMMLGWLAFAASGQAEEAPFEAVPFDTAAESSEACGWADVDNDGLLDLLVANYGQPSVLYRQQQGTFVRVPLPSLPNGPAASYVAAWGDVNNDGWIDLFVADFSGLSLLFVNDGTGGLQPFWNSGISAAQPDGAAWADYDRDGLLDLFLANHLGLNLLYRGRGDGTFVAQDGGDLTGEFGHTTGCVWVDYDQDGAPDVMVTNHEHPIFLYRNLGGQTFSKVLDAGLSLEPFDSHGAAWGDYDNDGLLDLFVSNGKGDNLLYHQIRPGRFEPVTGIAPVEGGGRSQGAAWGDYDNDGWLDLFVANTDGPNFLYHNDGHGLFHRLTEGAVVSADRHSQACAWGDYDGDGWLDLFVANSFGQANELYRNRGGRFHWLQVRCEGHASNRSGVGAKIWVEAVIFGSRQTQFREISGGGVRGGQNGLRAHFGLGDASRVERLRIRWPSGWITELRDLPADQSLTVREPVALSVQRGAQGQVRLWLQARRGTRCVIERSVDLRHWTPAGTLTNLTARQAWEDDDPASGPCSFYRARLLAPRND